jgi:predicted nucleotidyltransferase
MDILKEHSPLLVGSVWRGTIHYASDIDIAVCHDESAEIVSILKRSGVRIIQTERVTVTKKGKRRGSFHIYVELPDREKAEIKVVHSSDASRKEKCEIYGDQIRGLNIKELEKMFRENPLQRFVPS